MLEISGKTIGKYLIMERVGYGGMSAIYKARDTTDNSIVAFKVLSAAMASDPTFEARFSREIDVLSTLDHPNIVPILDYGTLGGLIYIVMPFYQHGTLDDLIDQGITAEEGAKIINQVAAALEYAHEKGITHRDVKPSNILLDENGNAILSDFGFAHIADSTLSLTGSSLIGTPSYMSPEQCRGEEINGSSDQYSLGVVIYKMVTGELPFEADTLMAVVYKHLNDPIPNPRDINPNVSEDVEDVLLKALSKDPSRRYASVSALNHAFQIALAPQKAALSAISLHWLTQRKRIMRFRRRISQSISTVTRSPKLMRRFSVGMAAALVFAIPTTIWAIAEYGEVDLPAAVEATLSAMETQAGPDTAFDPTEMVAAIIADLTQTAIGDVETPTPTQSPSATPSPSPTLTATPTIYWVPPTATPRPTATPLPTIHVRSIRGGKVPGAPPNWTATGTVTIYDSNGNAVRGAIVNVHWTVSGSPVETFCETLPSGSCTVHNYDLLGESTTMTVTGVEHSYEYNPANNEVPSWITITK